MMLRTTHYVKTEDRSRRYLLTQTGQAEDTPLVLVFHGGGSNPEGVRWESRFDDVAAVSGFSVAYLSGTPVDHGPDHLFWNDGRVLSSTGQPLTVDDVDYVEAVLLEVPHRQGYVYAAGYSNGAQFAYRLAQQLSHRIAAVGCVAGQRGPNEIFPAPPRPVPIIQFSGVRDRIAPYRGGRPMLEQFVTNLQPAPTVVRQWATHNGLSGVTPVASNIGQAQRLAYGDKAILWTLRDGGHTWPGGNAERAFLGPVNHDCLAAQEMARFFASKRVLV